VARWENISGSAVSVPVVSRDVEAGDVVEVPDDVVLPSNYFRLEGTSASDPLVEQPAPVVDTFAVVPIDEGE
jgi:hypothetical protein